ERHSSRPPLPSSALKKSVPLTFASDAGAEPAPPGLTSWTRAVPPAVPSLLHSSAPLVPSFAAKNTVSLTFLSEPGEGHAVPGGLPAVRHRSRRWVPSSASSKSRTAALASDRGAEPRPPARMSRSIAVPAASPLLLHSSAPLAPLLAAKKRTPLTFVSPVGL